jgi:hypothetical protein
MSDCCTPPADTAAHPRKRSCPGHGGACAEVSARTIAHHLKQPWHWQDRGVQYYFCDDPACDIVYFGDDGSTIRKDQLRTAIGIKDAAPAALLCYCFGVTRADAARDPAIRNYVQQQTKLGLCTCDTRNPSGRCCLKDFPRGAG